jgi:hypothetical protein
MTLNHSCQTGQHPLIDRGRDSYPTPRVATEALLQVEVLPHWVWEPAAGRGSIVNVLRDHGYAVIASDIFDYGFALHFCRDFLAKTKAPAGVDLIISNPPFQIATQFVAHALKLCPRVIMLGRLAFLESEKRTTILDTGTLARVHIFKKRLPMMHRDGWAGPRASNAMPFAWFVWDADHAGPTTVDRISWR